MVLGQVQLRRFVELLFGAALECRPTLTAGDPPVARRSGVLAPGLCELAPVRTSHSTVPVRALWISPVCPQPCAPICLHACAPAATRGKVSS